MRSCLVFSLISLSLVSSANAVPCHHYSKWFYPYPQPRCGVTARWTDDPNDHSWYVEIIKLPPSWTLDERNAGIEKLKELMK